MFLIGLLIPNAASFCAGESETPAVNPMVLEKELLLRVLVEVVTDLLMLELHIVLELVKLFANYTEGVVEFGLDNKFMTIQRVEIDRGFDHLLELCETPIVVLDKRRQSCPKHAGPGKDAYSELCCILNVQWIPVLLIYHPLESLYEARNPDDDLICPHDVL